MKSLGWLTGCALALACAHEGKSAVGESDANKQGAVVGRRPSRRRTRRRAAATACGLSGSRFRRRRSPLEAAHRCHAVARQGDCPRSVAGCAVDEAAGAGSGSARYFASTLVLPLKARWSRRASSPPQAKRRDAFTTWTGRKRVRERPAGKRVPVRAWRS